VWPGFAAVAERLGAIVVGGPNEPWATYRPELDELIALLASASVVLGSDSGPAHLAARLGVRTGVVFGPTDPAVWAPLGATVFPWDVAPETLVAWVRNGL
jgi:ADP-heptose:LPS heptosyltransferase